LWDHGPETVTGGLPLVVASGRAWLAEVLDLPRERITQYYRLFHRIVHQIDGTAPNARSEDLFPVDRTQQTRYLRGKFSHPDFPCHLKEEANMNEQECQSSNL
jgi:hypothetical protein